MKVRFKKLHPEAKTPTYSHADDAAMDLTATSFEQDEFGNYSYGIGLALEIPENHVGLIFPRSSNHKKSLVMSNSVAVIDPGYRGEIVVKFKHYTQKMYHITNDNSYEISNSPYQVGDRIAQLIIVPRPHILFEESEVLSESIRGENGYGSTGK